MCIKNVFKPKMKPTCEEAKVILHLGNRQSMAWVYSSGHEGQSIM